MSKNLAIAIIGGGRWARALGGRLAHNPDRVGRVVQLVRNTDEHRQRAEAAAPGDAGAGVELSDDMRVLGKVDVAILAVSAGAARGLLREAGAVLHGGQFLVHAIGSLEPGAQAADDHRGAARFADDHRGAARFADDHRGAARFADDHRGAARFADDHRGAARFAIRMSDVIQQETAVRRIGALAGPALAQDLEEGRPAALICGSRFDEVGQAVSGALSSSSLRVYTTRDLFGVELARAMVAEVAVAAGVARALEMGPAARAILIARGAAEMARLGTALGASERTFFGLAGVGELVVATEGRGSADFELGVALGRGLPLPEALKRIGRRCDGPTMVAEAYRLGQQHGVRMTLTTALHRWLGGERSMQQGLRDLFAGDDRGE